MAVYGNHSHSRILSRDDSGFPVQLTHPLVVPVCNRLFVKGSLPATKRCVALVGTRKASAFGKQFAHRCARELAVRGFCIVSGLAYGIDAEAHIGALEGNGITVAVLAHGLDTISPVAHKNLSLKILKNRGALVSEYEDGTPAVAYRFLERNRIISALSEAVVVIEAPRKSGAVRTGMCALKQKKPLFVLPGPVSSALFSGSHGLIRAGGKLFSSVHELLSDLNVDGILDEKQSEMSAGAKIILRVMQKEDRAYSVDTISELCTLKPQDIQVMLSELILKNAVIEEGVGKYRLTGA